MRRKSRILLCFAVLWVLGIAYYFYSGTAMSRKVGSPSPDCLFLASRFACAPVWMFPPWTKRRRSPVPSPSRWARFSRPHRCCEDPVKGPARLSAEEAPIHADMSGEGGGAAGLDLPLRRCAGLPGSPA